MISLGGPFSIPLVSGLEFDFAPRKAAVRPPVTRLPLAEYIADHDSALAGCLLPMLERGGASFHPLVLCGPTCTGKTVLALTLARRWQQLAPQSKSLLLTAADFARALSHAVQTDGLEEFREKFQAASLIVIDDVQHLEGKTAAQDELRRLLDEMSERGAHLIVTSRVSVAELPFSPDLRGRLSQGLIVPLRWPGDEARREIISRYLSSHRVGSLSPEGIARLATTYSGPPSRLFAALAELVHTAETDRRPLDDSLLGETLKEHDANITPRAIIAAVSKQFQIPLKDLRGPGRRQAINEARGVAMHLLREVRKLTYAEIGALFGDRDHTTVMHACQKTSERLASDPLLRQSLETITAQLHETL